VVTGSRIRRTDFTTAAPVQIITTDDAKLAGRIDAVDVLQRSTIAAGSVQLNNQFGGFVVPAVQASRAFRCAAWGASHPGAAERPAPEPGRRQRHGRRRRPQRDPSALVERYEILKDGASSIYGSDAIGGVVNIITRNKFDGVTMETDDSFPTHGYGNNYDVAARSAASATTTTSRGRRVFPQ